MSRVAIERVGQVTARVGEGAVWDVGDQALWWVDIPAGRIHRHDPSGGAERSWEIGEAVGEVEVKKSELEMARQLVGSMAGGFDPADYRNSYRDELRTMLEAKLSGKEIVHPEPVAEAAPVVDLMEALKQSVEAAKASKPAAEGAGRRKAGARAKRA